MANEELAKRFGILMRSLRLEKGLSQETFSFRVGLHQTYVSSLERGERNVTISTASRIAEALDLTLAEFFMMMEETEPTEHPEDRQGGSRS
ncbi:helix-turn-helix domain-containing protein [Rubrobacter radiotolerans]|uniref:helix-turn-helix domain-containing protein n=1 Tax=Rubrobacter radiotolerans TaxID=42256 RepID=UPI0009D593FE|nr:Helix-turn-helix [Rubrobacter radiotolerans DSM 5868]